MIRLPKLSRRKEILLDFFLLFAFAVGLIRPFLKAKYLDFVGGWLGERMVLERSTAGPSPLRQRMTWHDITDNGFVWDWAARAPQQDDWDLTWQLRYERIGDDRV